MHFLRLTRDELINFSFFQVLHCILECEGGVNGSIWNHIQYITQEHQLEQNSHNAQK